jgi:hypothetical protein
VHREALKARKFCKGLADGAPAEGAKASLKEIALSRT